MVRQLQEGNRLPLPGQDGVLSLFQHGEHFISVLTTKISALYLAVPKKTSMIDTTYTPIMIKGDNKYQVESSETFKIHEYAFCT